MATTTKELQTDLSPFIKIYTDGTAERLLVSPYVPPTPEDPATGVSTKDTAITPGVSARIYLPKLTTPEKLPILVYYHGGGFCLESAFSFIYHRFVNILSAAAGALVVSVEYRLAPEHHLPAAYEDSWKAFEWICSHGANADETHIEKDDWVTNHGDLDRIFIGGDSAGGNVVHNIALRHPLLGKLNITGAILLHPYFWGSDAIGNESKEDIQQILAYRLWMMVYPSVAGGIDSPFINPLADGAPALSGLGCSKLMVCVSEKDLLMARGLAYAEGVKKSGWKGEVEVVEIDGEDHCFQLFDPETENAKYLIKRVAAFISDCDN